MFSERVRILVVDDMPKMRQIISSQIKSLGFTDVVTASDGKEALDLLNKQHEEKTPIELIFSDWNMPIMPGIELLRAIRQSETLKHLPFIMVTAEGQRDQVMEAIKFGVSNYIVKPFPPVQLELKIKAVWEKQYSKKS
jgi:two-component system chemotaxis response regulator CheY